MSKEKGLNLSEAALTILGGSGNAKGAFQQNVASKNKDQDKFGNGETLRDTVNKHAKDIGNANFGDYDMSDVPTATPPGETPPVGSEPMKKITGQPEEKPSKAKNKVKQDPPKGVNEDEDEDEDENEVNEDIEALMAGENLSTDFKRKATSIFEAAVKARVALVAEELEGHYIQQFEEAYEEMKEDLSTKVDEYLDYVVENWMEDNELAVESGLRSEISESFIDALKGVFEEHYIDIPDEKFDVVEELSAKVESLEKQINENIQKNIDLKQKLSEQKKVDALHSVCEGLTLTQTDKLKSIAESVAFKSENEFISHMEDIKESYFSTKQSIKPASRGNWDDRMDLTEDTERVAAVDPVIAAYASKISKTLLR
jgi:hypothetical protein